MSCLMGPSLSMSLPRLPLLRPDAVVGERGIFLPGPVQQEEAEREVLHFAEVAERGEPREQVGQVVLDGPNLPHEEFRRSLVRAVLAACEALPLPFCFPLGHGTSLR